MQPIEISEKQKEMLLEMCVILFPEYIINFENDYGESLNILNFNLNTVEWYHWNLIHWFELCMTHLPVAMYRWAMHQKNIKPDEAFKIIQGNLTKLEDFDRYYINPVEYLYEKFKSLK